MHLCESLLKDNYSVMGLDNMNSYYDEFKEDRLSRLNVCDCFNFKEIDIADGEKLNKVF